MAKKPRAQTPPSPPQTAVASGTAPQSMVTTLTPAEDAWNAAGAAPATDPTAAQGVPEGVAGTDAPTPAPTVEGVPPTPITESGTNTAATPVDHATPATRESAAVTAPVGAEATGFADTAKQVVDFPLARMEVPNGLPLNKSSDSPAHATQPNRALALPDLPYHPLCELFPWMSPPTYDLFRLDIELGHRTILIVWIYQGMIIDGRHTYRACKELGRQPEFREWDGQGSLLDFVIAQNLHTRHLSSSQRACLALDLEPQLAAEAAARRQRGKADVPQKVGDGEPNNDRHAGETLERAAKVAGTNREYVGQAKRLRTQWPEQFQQVRSGEIELGEATRLLREAMANLKLRSPQLHQEVLGGKRTVPQAERAAKRLPQETGGAPIPQAKQNDAANRPAMGTTHVGDTTNNLTKVVASPSGELFVNDRPAEVLGEPPQKSASNEEPLNASGAATSVTEELTDDDQNLLKQLKATWRLASTAVKYAFLTRPSVRAALQRMGVSQ